MDISAKARRAKEAAEQEEISPYRHRVIRRRARQIENDMVDLTEAAFKMGSGRDASITQTGNFGNLAHRKAALEDRDRRRKGAKK